MNKEYIIPHKWSIIEEGFDPDNVKSSESLFSLGNGAMGQRANFEEDYSGPTFQGSYIAGVYYPDKTRVGWWKNGYPEYFAKVLNAPNWIGVRVHLNGNPLDLFAAREVRNFRRELDMKEGVYRRSFEIVLPTGEEARVEVTRLLHLELDELGMIRYNITPLSGDMEITYQPYLDGGITNEDSNWDDKFWDTLSVTEEGHQAFIRSMTMKTEYHICTYMESRCYLDGSALSLDKHTHSQDQSIAFTYKLDVAKGRTASLVKFGGYTVSLNHQSGALVDAAKNTLERAWTLGFDRLLEKQREAWGSIWEMADIVIDGDVKAQQGIRFNIFQLNQTYLGKDARLNIGPKGFTGEKYGGSTYWDTEAYCLTFYMATKDHEVARNLLVYRYNHLQKAIENAEKLGFSGGAALYPMVTMNGEESHNEWEITFEEIHRNGAIAFAIFNYVRYTGDWDYVPEKGLEVLIAIARFWHQRANFSEPKGKYVILGVTGPNEYENNVNNNWYTNYQAKWCIEYATAQLDAVRDKNPDDYKRIMDKTGLDQAEVEQWNKVAAEMYFPYWEEKGVYLQQDGFLDKEMVPVSQLDPSQRPINQHWSWDRILRSPYIKQADTLQGFYFFEDHFSKEELERHYDFYEPFTVHESSLSPCVHSVQAARLGRMEKAYQLYLRTSRLDLDDYNKEVEEGCHITSMAGTWLSIVEGFGGMRLRDGKLHFQPQLPDHWEGFSFKVNFRGSILKVSTTKDGPRFSLQAEQPLTIVVNGEEVTVQPNG